MSLAPWWASPATLIVGAVLAFVGAWLNTNRSLKHQREQEKVKDAQNLRNKRFERLHAAYHALVYATQRLQQDAIILEGDIGGWAEESEPSRQKRQQERNLALAQAKIARITLMLEGETDGEAWQLFDQICKAFDRYFDILVEHSADERGEWKTIDDGANRILEIAQTRLKALQEAL